MSKAKFERCFFYGSQLDVEQLRARCPSAQLEGTATLPNHALAFGGCADIGADARANVLPAREQHVQGVIAQVSAQDLERLDRDEGRRHAFAREGKMVRDRAGKWRRVQVYLQPESLFSTSAPATTYLQQIARAYERLGFDQKPLWRAAEQATAQAADEVEVQGALVFVFGELLLGERNQYALARAKRLGPARTLPLFRMHDLGDGPALVRGGAECIVGELFEVDGSTLDHLGFLESHPSQVERTQIVLEGGMRAFAFVTAAEHVADRPIVTSGDWRAHRKARAC